MVNEYFKLVDYGGTLQYYIFELANFSVLAFLVLVLYKFKVINSNSLVVWIGIFFSPLLINYFVLSPWMYGDQFEYAAEVMSLKSTGESTPTIALNTNLGTWNPVTLSVKILGLTPLPNYMTVTSLAFANKFFLLLTFLWFKRFFNNENEVLLYFLIPSLILYSSMGLRDTLIIVLSLVIIINVLRNRFLLPILLLYPLFYLKIQMSVFLSVYLVGRFLFRAHKNKYFFRFFVISGLAFALIYSSLILEVLNLYRIAFVAEDFSFNGEISYNAFSRYGQGEREALMLSSLPEAILVAAYRLPELLLMPLPWNWSNIFYPLQSLESCLLIYIYIKLATRQELYKNYEFILLTFILFLGLGIYALLMSNEGTFVRYRFDLYYPFLLAVFYLANQPAHASKK
ncbi:hypothetical protein OAD39_01305 [Gammaproteobacteria bacterium]|jgi:hypothetical protein|nr:hypothetical protein [Gammaproteobacteria bacterium]